MSLGLHVVPGCPNEEGSADSMASGSRRRVGAFVFLGLDAFLAVSGLVGAILGHGPARVRAATGFLLFGVAGISYGILLLRRPPIGLAGVTIGWVEIDQTEEPAFLLTYPTAWGVALFVPLLMFAGAAVVAATSMGPGAGGARTALIAAAVFFGGIGILGLWGLAYRPQGLALTRSGPALLSLRRPRVFYWDSISEVDTRRQRFDVVLHMAWVGIRFGPAEEPTRPRSQRLSRRLFGWDVFLPASWLEIDPVVLERVLRHYVEHPDSRRTIGAVSGLKELGDAVDDS
jgi:hypothetical protein